jgi:dipeptidyl aminopeptidase/acylaminoacyl peptidase
MKKWIFILIIVILAAYCGISYYFSNQLLYPPLLDDEGHRAEYGPILPEEVGLAAEEVSFPARGSDEITITAWWIEEKPTAPKKAFVLVHGRRANKKALVRFAPIFASRGISTLLVDLRGHGESSDGCTTFGDREREDVIGAVDYLFEKGYSPDDRIGIYGISMGGTTAFLAAMDLNGEKPGSVDIMILDSMNPDVPASIELNSRKVVGKATPFLLPGALLTAKLRSGADYEDGNPIAHVDGIDIPAFFIMHDMDEQIPYNVQMNMYERYKGPKEELTFKGLMHHKGHAEKGAEYDEAIRKFLQQHDF